ncbi:MAG: DUF4333 domain-containing protein [Gordonia sp. (in: high G+C Gram-positive bacteria)]
MTNNKFRMLAVALLAGAVVGISGCSTSVGLGDKKVEQSTLETNSGKELAKSNNLSSAPEVKCHGDLKGEVGATQKCDVQDTDGTWKPFTAKVTSVDGNDVKWDINPDTAPTPTSTTEAPATTEAPEDGAAVDQTTLESVSATELAKSNNLSSPPEIKCHGDLKGQIGATQKCDVQDTDGTWKPFTATVTSVEGTNVRWDINPD